MHHRGVDSYNFFVWQRPAVILAESRVQARADWAISKLFAITSFLVTETMVKSQKFIDRTTPFRGAIAPVDDITLRCNHSTSHVNEAWARRKALKSRQRANFMNLEA